ncbi:hypothetical protein JOE25_004669 [Serratia sp. PL17]|nr:hypothetical protein [Serratia sp. PL17]
MLRQAKSGRACSTPTPLTLTCALPLQQGDTLADLTCYIGFCPGVQL